MSVNSTICSNELRNVRLSCILTKVTRSVRLSFDYFIKSGQNFTFFGAKRRKAQGQGSEAPGGSTPHGDMLSSYAVDTLNWRLATVLHGPDGETKDVLAEG